MSEARPTPIRFTVGGRCLWQAERRLVPVTVPLDALMQGHRPALPPLPAQADGYRILCWPVRHADSLGKAMPGAVEGSRETYMRRAIDMRIGQDAYLSGFSAKTRSTLARKARRLAKENGGALDIRSAHMPEDMDGFFEAALAVSRKTYQARLLDAGLPEDPAFREAAKAMAAEDRLRAFLLYLNGDPIAYLYLPVESDTLIYAYLGYDPEHRALSAGTVLQMEALASLFAEQRFAWLDFTEGDGPHKALFATHGVECVAMTLLRPNLANRALLAASDSFDAAVEGVRDLANRAGVAGRLRRLIRQ